MDRRSPVYLISSHSFAVFPVSPSFKKAMCTDGGIHRRLILDANQLRSGKLFYWPVNKAQEPVRASGEAEHHSSPSRLRNNFRSGILAPQGLPPRSEA